MEEIRREDDGELCGFVDHRADGWHSLAVFGGTLDVHDSCDDAERHVRSEGLASLAERWRLLNRSTGEDQVVCIQEASPQGVTLALDYYSLPGVPSLRISSVELAGGDWALCRRAPA